MSKRKGNKQPNETPIYISCDTETQLTWCDDFISYQTESYKLFLKELETWYIRGKFSRLEYHEELKKAKANWGKFLACCKELGIDTRICDTIETYALGWIEYNNLHVFRARNIVTLNHLDARDEHIFEEHKAENEWDCQQCHMKMKDDVSLVENRDYVDNPKNVWQGFLDDLCERYGDCVKKGNTHKLRVYIHNLKFDARSLEFYYGENPDLFDEFEAIVPQNTYYILNFVYRGCVFEVIDSFKMISQALGNASKLVNMRKTTEDATYEWFDLIKEDETYNNEISYLKFDVLILQHLLRFIGQNLDLEKLTSSSFAQDKLKMFIRIDDKKYHRKYYDRIYKTGITKEQDEYYRKAYSGGITIVQPSKENKEYNMIGFSFDVNSEYPAVMLQNYPDPSAPQALTSKNCSKVYNKKDFQGLHSIYRVHIKVLKLKDGMVACFPKKVAKFAQTQAIITLDDIVDDGFECIQTLTGLDLNNIEQNYDIEYDFIDGVTFTRVLRTPFKHFVENYKSMKEQAVRDHNKPLKMVSKLLLNGVYGKFAERFHDMKDVIYFDDKGFPHYEEVPNEKEYEQKGNIVIACMVTAKARNLIVSQARIAVERPFTDLIYIDTDSIHCNYWGKYETQLKKYAKMIREGKEVDSKKLDRIFANVCKEVGIDYDEARFGALKAEGYYDKSKYLGAKRYVEHDLVEGTNFKIAGLQGTGKDYIEKMGLDYFGYENTHIIKAPFVKLVKVNKGFKFVNSFKILSPQSDKAGIKYV